MCQEPLAMMVRTGAKLNESAMEAISGLSLNIRESLHSQGSCHRRKVECLPTLKERYYLASALNFMISLIHHELLEGIFADQKGLLLRKHSRSQRIHNESA